jgi:hypothetical protein
MGVGAWREVYAQQPMRDLEAHPKSDRHSKRHRYAECLQRVDLPRWVCAANVPLAAFAALAPEPDIPEGRDEPKAADFREWRFSASTWIARLLLPADSRVIFSPALWQAAAFDPKRNWGIERSLVLF